jgi:CHC2 zinc finger/Abortive infection C-terminus
LARGTLKGTKQKRTYKQIKVAGVIAKEGLPSTAFEKAVELQELLVRHATGGTESEETYSQLRREFQSRLDTRDLVPSFARTCRNLSSFWSWVKRQAPQWEQRRVLIRDAFQPLLDYLEHHAGAPPDGAVSAVLESFDNEGVHTAWMKALERRLTDPSGAITAARTLIETVCKRILDDLSVTFDEDEDLPKLYRLTAEALKLAPDQHTEGIFKSILGSSQNIVNSLGTLRNKIGDAHGKSRPVKVAPRHAALAVNLAGAVSTFLIETHIERLNHTQKLIEEIRLKLPTSAVVGTRVRLKQAGREWKGLSPFASEKTPSFYVNDAKGFYHCFNTGKHGDVFSFLMETENITLAE